MANVITLWGERGTPASVTIPGMANADTFDVSTDLDDFMGANGEAKASGASKTVTNPATDFILTDTGAFTGLTLTSMYIYISAGASAVGYYEIQSSTNDAVTFSPTNLDGTGAVIGTNDHTYTIGGAGDIDDPDTSLKLQALFDLMGQEVATTHNLDIHLNQAVTLISNGTGVGVDIDSMSGLALTQINVFATNSSFVSDGTNVTMDTNTALTGALWKIGTTQVNVHFYDFILDAGANTDNATHCLELLDGSGNVGFTRWYDCTFQGATDDNIRCDAGGINADRWPLELYNPTITGAGAAGIGRAAVGLDCVPYIKGGMIHGNVGAGIEVSGSCSVVDGVRIYNNGEGLNFDGFTKNVSVSNCTIDDTGDAFVWDGLGASSDGVVISNCAITNNDVDFAPTGSAYADWVVINCLLNGNTVTYTPVAGIITQRNIQTGVPGYTNQAGRDYTPTSSSNLIDNGVSGTGDTIGALCATVGGGGILIHTGMTGGIRG